MRIFYYLFGNSLGVKKCATALLVLTAKAWRDLAVGFGYCVNVPLLRSRWLCPGQLNTARKFLLPLVVMKCFAFSFPVRDEISQFKWRHIGFKVYSP